MTHNDNNDNSYNDDNIRTYIYPTMLTAKY